MPEGAPLYSEPLGGQPLGRQPPAPGERLPDDVLGSLDVEAAESHRRRVHGADDTVDICPPGAYAPGACHAMRGCAVAASKELDWTSCALPVCAHWLNCKGSTPVVKRRQLIQDLGLHVNRNRLPCTRVMLFER